MRPRSSARERGQARTRSAPRGCPRRLADLAWTHRCTGRTLRARQLACRFTPDQVAFFTFFAEPIANFEEDALAVIATGLLEGACPVDVRRSARLLQAYELDFWQAASDPPGSPRHVHPPR